MASFCEAASRSVRTISRWLPAVTTLRAANTPQPPGRAVVRRDPRRRLDLARRLTGPVPTSPFPPSPPPRDPSPGRTTPPTTRGHRAAPSALKCGCSDRRSRGGRVRLFGSSRGQDEQGVEMRERRSH